jgi:hypothetical protein
MVGLFSAKAKRRLLYLLVLLAVFLLQTTRGLLPRPWGATVNLYPFLVCAMAFSDGPYAGGLYGFAAGLLLAVGSGTPEGLDAGLYALYGILCGYGATSVLRRGLLTELVCGSLLSLVRCILGWLVYYGLAYAAPVGPYLLTWFIGLVCSAALSIPAHSALRAIARRYHEDTL